MKSIYGTGCQYRKIGDREFESMMVDTGRSILDFFWKTSALLLFLSTTNCPMSRPRMKTMRSPMNLRLDHHSFHHPLRRNLCPILLFSLLRYSPTSTNRHVRMQFRPLQQSASTMVFCRTLSMQIVEFPGLTLMELAHLNSQGVWGWLFRCCLWRLRFSFTSKIAGDWVQRCGPTCPILRICLALYTTLDVLIVRYSLV